MVHKYKQDPVTGVIWQPLTTTIFGGALFFAILVIASAILPSFSSYYLYASIPFGILGFISLVWLNVKPNLYARFFLNIGISVLCVITAYRAFDNLLPQFSFLGAGLLIFVVAFVHTLPMWNSPLANFIRDELSAPKTKIGKVVFRTSLALIPIIGISSAMIGSILHRENKSAGLSLILVFLSLLIAIVLQFGYRFPSSPWETKKSKPN